MKGGNNMTAKVLVAYATALGTTAEIAQEIGRVLAADSSAQVDVRPVGEITSVQGYDAVVIGSAIRDGRWLPEASSFLDKHLDALRRVPVAYFLACRTLIEDTPGHRREVAGYLDPIRSRLRPVSEGHFAGVFDHSKFPATMRFFMKLGRLPNGDFRNWDGIRAWAHGLSPLLLAQPVAA
jgi:menaquinone-dependent protoporphyrinogen oxidase